MRTFVTAILTASLVLPLAVGASAQQRERPGDAQRDREQQRQAWTKPEGVVESSKLIGAKVRDAQGKDIGEIDRLLVNREDGKVSHVVVGKGGFAGVGESKLVVSWDEMKFRMEGNDVVVSMDQGALDKAPRYAGERDRERTPAASPGTSPRPSTSPSTPGTSPGTTTPRR